MEPDKRAIVFEKPAPMDPAQWAYQRARLDELVRAALERAGRR